MNNYIELVQKTATLDDGRILAYVDMYLVSDNYRYKLTINKKARARYNTMLRLKYGFVIGIVENSVDDKIIYLN